MRPRRKVFHTFIPEAVARNDVITSSFNPLLSSLYICTWTLLSEPLHASIPSGTNDFSPTSSGHMFASHAVSHGVSGDFCLFHDCLKQGLKSRGPPF